MAIPSFCRRDQGFGDDERPLRLAPSTISVETADGEMQVKVWIGGHGFPIVVLHGSEREFAGSTCCGWASSRCSSR